MRTPTDKFPSSEAFVAIDDALKASEADRKDAIKQANAVFGITLKNAAGETESWHIDLKTEGAVHAGLDAVKPNGKQESPPKPSPGPPVCLCLPVCFADAAQVTLILSDADFGNLVAGKANAQRLFMAGKLKIKGDMMKATKLDVVLKKVQTKAKL